METTTPTGKRVLVKPAVKSKEIWGALIAALGAFLAALGIAIDVSFLDDGFNLMDDYVPFLGALMAVIGYVIQTYGKRAAVSMVSGIITPKKPT